MMWNLFQDGAWICWIDSTLGGLPLIGTQPPCEVKVSDILYIEGRAWKLKWCCFLNALVMLTVDQTTGPSYVLICVNRRLSSGWSSKTPCHTTGWFRFGHESSTHHSYCETHVNEINHAKPCKWDKSLNLSRRFAGFQPDQFLWHDALPAWSQRVFFLQAESENVGLCFAAALVDESKVHGLKNGNIVAKGAILHPDWRWTVIFHPWNGISWWTNHENSGIVKVYTCLSTFFGGNCSVALFVSGLNGVIWGGNSGLWLP